MAVALGCGAQNVESLTLSGSEGKLYAELQKPSVKAGEKMPLVIICHGFSDNCNSGLL